MSKLGNLRYKRLWQVFHYSTCPKVIAQYTFPAYQNIHCIIGDFFDILECALVHGMRGKCIEGDKKCIVDIYIFQHF